MYLDYHAPKADMTTEQKQQMTKIMDQVREMIIAEKKDEFGVKPVNVFKGVNGAAWCLTEAPNAQAVVKSHNAKGGNITEKDIVEVHPLAEVCTAHH